MESTALKKCLIVGAGGLIGSHLVPELTGRWRVHAASRNCSRAFRELDIAWHPLDLLSSWDTSKLPARLDAVVYLAQSEHFRNFPERAEDIFAVNTGGVLRMLEYARRAGAHTFLFASSGGVYGSGEAAFSEDLRISAEGELGYYLSTKICSEIISANYTPFMNVLVLRFFFVYGPGQRRSMLIPRLVDSVQAGKPIRLHGADGIRINPIYVSDAVAAIRQALEVQGSFKINVAGPDVLTMREVGETIGRVIGRSPVFEVEEETELKHIVGDISRMADLLGGPKVRFERGVEMLTSRALVAES